MKTMMETTSSGQEVASISHSEYRYHTVYLREHVFFVRNTYINLELTSVGPYNVIAKGADLVRAG